MFTIDWKRQLSCQSSQLERGVAHLRYNLEGSEPEPVELRMLTFVFMCLVPQQNEVSNLEVSYMRILVEPSLGINLLFDEIRECSVPSLL